MREQCHAIVQCKATVVRNRKSLCSRVEHRDTGVYVRPDMYPKPAKHADAMVRRTGIAAAAVILGMAAIGACDEQHCCASMKVRGAMRERRSMA